MQDNRTFECMTNREEETSRSVTVQSRRRKLHRVPIQLRQGKKQIYEPVVVPLGPYHHRLHPQSHLVEPLKNKLKDIVCGDFTSKSLFLCSICARLDEIRYFYGGADGYTDGELAEMMLRDACFLICYIERGETFNLIFQRLGVSGVLFMARDMFMLENQIPLWLISLIHPDHNSLLCQYLSYNNFGDNRLTQLPWANGRGEEPLHLLEALCTSLFLDETQEYSSNLLRLVKKCNNLYTGKQGSRTNWQMMNTPFWSATDLKAKGVHFRRSSYCLTDIKFESFAWYAELHLPFFYITYNSKVFFSNAIAFEMSPETDTNMGVTAYFNFMKIMISNAKDVKVLREKDILYSMLANDEEVVEMVKSIDTYGFASNFFFSDVNMRIEKHCTSKARTWMAELINTNFRSPWSVIALAAATFLLCLTFIQTYFTINPTN
ncbi:uncharacterized protein LOC125186974 isoform X1 [Salvia hispanica]|uniref:uncharacterized protein LOC125186974 isoform X1 n=1 Tax=Salvia hispanica TaxID=49212 RepID=UPI00200990F2|nr:uncharacterized protein LOC125186974 isoform X1 [Salvia hispanica]